LAKQQVVVADPKGDWWGLLFGRDGKSPGLPFVVLGGEHGHIKLESGAGELVARMVVTERVSLVLDLSEFRKHEVATFMTAFMENLYRLKAQEQHRTPMMLIIDEADAIAPQRPQKGEERMLGAVEDLVRRGGQRGIGVTMITQRSAVLNKNVLTQIGILIVLRTIAPQDLTAMEAWIQVHGSLAQADEMMTSLPSLPIGTGWVWAPGWPDGDGIFQRSAFLLPDTFDSSKTPGQSKAILPKNAADVDLEAFKRDMAATIAKHQADDPRLLRRRIQELEKQVAHGGSKGKVPEARIVERPVLKEAQLTKLRVLITRAEQALERAGTVIAKPVEALRAELKSVLETLALVRQPIAPAPGAQRAYAHDRPPSASPRQPAATSNGGSARAAAAGGRADGSLPPGERAVLIAAAQYPDGLTREQATILTAYKRSSRDAYIQRLMGKGYVELRAGDVYATPAGIAALGSDYEPLPTGPDLQRYWLERLPPGERVVLEAAIRAYPQMVDREGISEATGYKRSSRDAYIQRLAARRLVVPGHGTVKASDVLFD
jgi:uncharacterized protein